MERSSAFLNDPLFLASSVFLKKPHSIMALCMPVYHLAEHRLRQQLAATSQTPDQVKKPTNQPTMRWVFQCFEGIELLRIRHGPEQSASALIPRLALLHQQILTLLGPTYERFYASRR